MTIVVHAALLLALPLALPAFAADADRTISADLLRIHLPPKAKDALDKAQRAADSGDHRRAIALLETNREKFPEANAWTESMLGVEYLKMRQFEAAVEVLEEAVLLLPREPLDHANLGLALAAIGQSARAEQELQRAVQLDGSNMTTRRLLEAVRQQAPELTSSLR